jgi:hypothetical protein
MALYGPVSLFSLVATWLVLTGIGYMLLFWSLGERSLREALVLIRGAGEPADRGAGLLRGRDRPGPAGLLISYLPSMYQSFQRREAAVAALDVPADTPPTGTAMLIRVSVIGGWDRLEELWRDWERWWEHSWVTASGRCSTGRRCWRWPS